MDKTVINFRLSDLRKAKHITQGELAEFVGTSFQTISKWENGITMPDITVLPVLAAFFEVSIDELLSNSYDLSQLLAISAIFGSMDCTLDLAVIFFILRLFFLLIL